MLYCYLWLLQASLLLSLVSQSSSWSSHVLASLWGVLSQQLPALLEALQALANGQIDARKVRQPPCLHRRGFAVVP